MKDAATWIKECDVALFIPCMNCAPTPGGILKFGFEANVHAKGGKGIVMILCLIVMFILGPAKHYL